MVRRALLQLRTGGPSRRDSMRRAAESKLADIDRRIHDLGSVRDALRRLVDSCACDADAGRPHCPILEALEEKQHPAA